MEQDPPKAPTSRRTFFFFGALALAALPRTALAQAVGAARRPLRRWRPKPRTLGPADNLRTVTESVAMLDDWTSSRIRLVRRITMGATAGDVMRVNQLGYQEFLNRQLNYTQIDDSAVEAAIAARFPLVSQTNDQLFTADQFQVQTQLQEATIFRAAFSERQLYERMVEFWSDHFNIAIAKVGYLKVSDDREVIRRHALGKFRDLLHASAKSPAMLGYLDQNQSRRGAPNENYVRELMELHTLGVDNGYTQNDVAELARVFTGWTFTGRGTFEFNAGLHDLGAKTVMGMSFPATNQAGSSITEGERFLDFLAAHPDTATFVSTKMLRWLLQSEPTATQVAVVSRAFRATGGNIKLVVRAILNERWLSTAPAKLKRPFHLVVSGLRATAPTVGTLTAMNGQVNRLGQPLFQYETPDGYPDTVEYWSGNLMPRWTFATTLAASNAAALRVDTARFLTGTPDAAVDLIDTDFFGGEMSLGLRVALLNYARAGTFNDARARETMALAMSSAEFQWY